MSAALEVIGIRGLPEVREGDDLAALIADRAELRPGDVVVVAQKVVSKAEGALAPRRPGEDPREARRRLAREHARRVVADTPGVLITETPHGLVCANGGVDGSHAPEGAWVLLPEDPDASARRLREGLARLAGVDVPVIVTDTFGRPWRRGQTDVAIGLSGLAAIRDERGGTDRQGAGLEVTQTAVADELASAADLVRRKADGVPVVVVRGFAWTPDEASRLADLVRAAGEDQFRRGAGMLAGALAAELPAASGEPLTDEQVALASRVAARAGAKVSAEHGPAGTTLGVEGDRLAGGLVVAALMDLGLRASWRDDGDLGLVVEACGDPGNEPRR